MVYCNSWNILQNTVALWITLFCEIYHKIKFTHISHSINFTHVLLNVFKKHAEKKCSIYTLLNPVFYKLLLFWMSWTIFKLQNYFRAFITFNLKSKCNRNTIPQIFPVDCASWILDYCKAILNHAIFLKG